MAEHKNFCSCFKGGKLRGHSGECCGVNWHPGVLTLSKFKICVMRRLLNPYCISEISNAMLDSLFAYNHIRGLRFNHGRGFPLSRSMRLSVACALHSARGATCHKNRHPSNNITTPCPWAERNTNIVRDDLWIRLLTLLMR
jgi:hypothetical protein